MMAAKVAPVKARTHRTCHELGVCQGSAGCAGQACRRSPGEDGSAACLSAAANTPAQAGNVWLALSDPSEMMPMRSADWVLVGCVMLLCCFVFVAFFSFLASALWPAGLV